MQLSGDLPGIRGQLRGWNLSTKGTSSFCAQMLVKERFDRNDHAKLFKLQELRSKNLCWNFSLE